MLLLARRIHEEILVIDNETGEQIVVTPTGYRGNEVKIGIEASKLSLHHPAPRGAGAGSA
jgi:sRNA-binding carbon storage regulator CsrA